MDYITSNISAVSNIYMIPGPTPSPTQASPAMAFSMQWEKVKPQEV